MKHYNNVLFIGGPAANEWKSFTLENEASPWWIVAEHPPIDFNNTGPVVSSFIQHRYRILQYPIGQRYLTVALHSDIYDKSYDALDKAVLYALLQRDVAKIILGE